MLDILRNAGRPCGGRVRLGKGTYNLLYSYLYLLSDFYFLENTVGNVGKCFEIITNAK